MAIAAIKLFHNVIILLKLRIAISYINFQELNIINSYV